VLAAVAVVYLLRFTLSTVYLLRREVDWSEVAMVAPWLALLHGALAWIGGTNPTPLSPGAGIGLVLFAVGTLMGPLSEWARYRWKQVPEHRGHLYTGSLFQYTRHPNYLADVVLFTGYALVTDRAMALVFPLLVLVGFVFVHIPTLDRYLAERYGAEFRSYEGRTARLIPGLW
jgi:steroid 5-alpha reductase family enzyme